VGTGAEAVEQTTGVEAVEQTTGVVLIGSPIQTVLEGQHPTEPLASKKHLRPN
jgi:hypothetical protein